MNLRSLGNIVSKKPVTVAIIILAITSIFGFYASQMQISADLKTFLPNDEMVNADEKISDEFGDTDLMELIFIHNNTVSKESMNDMLKVEYSLINDSEILDYLKTPDNPGNSIISPVDLIIMGNLTLQSEKNIKKILDNVTNSLKDVNFTMISEPLGTLNGIMTSYEDIYNNASSIRNDAENIILLIFSNPEKQNGKNFISMSTLIDNLTYILSNSNDFGIKSKVLTILTPPLSQNTSYGNQTENPLMKYFLEDMNSSLSLNNKSISAHYFREMNNYSYYSLNYTNSSLSGGVEGTKNLMDSLNATKASILAGDNKTALNILNQTIYGVSQEINYMESTIPYYTNYNASLSKFLYDFNNQSVSYEDIKSVEENTSQMIKITSGDFQKSLMIFNDTFHNWTKNSYIFYDTIYEANSTRNACEGFIDSYYQNVMLNYSLTDIKMQINHNSTTNTTMRIDYLLTNLNSSRAQMEKETEMIEKALKGFESPYFLWFQEMLGDMEHVILNSPHDISERAVNIFNIGMEMMNSSYSSSKSPNSFSLLFYSLKNAFDSDVVKKYKYEMQNIFLTEMGMMNMNMNFSMNLSLNMSMPQMNMNLDIEEKRDALENMSYGDIVKTIENIENYNSSDITNHVNDAISMINNASNNMSIISSTLGKLIKNVNFIYNTTKNASVAHSLNFYENMSKNISAGSNGFKEFQEYLPQIGGFGYAMEKMSSQLDGMFSKDFNGKRAKASLMIVMLNSTYKNGETTKQHSDRMEKIEERVENVAKSVKTRAKIRAVGTSLISRATEEASHETMNVLLPVSIILIIIILAITFRNILDTLLGLLGLGMAILWAYGFGVLAGYQFNQILTTVAVLLVGIGIDYAIHTILRYREELRKGENVRDAMNEMIAHLGMGLALATITTIVAFLSNAVSPIPPIANFGVMNAVGIFGAFVIFTTFIPSVKILIDERREKKGKLEIRKEKERVGSGVVLLNKFMAIGAVAAEKHRYTVLVIVTIISIAALYGGENLGTTFDVKDFLPSNLEISNTIAYMTENFNSSEMKNNYILIEGEIENPETVRAVNETVNNLKDDRYVVYSDSYGISNVIFEWEEKNTTFAKMVSENDTNNDKLPDENISEIYEWLYENTDDGRAILHKNNGNFDSMLIVVRSNATTDKEDEILYDDLKGDIQPLKNEGLKAISTGSNLLTFHIVNMLEGSQWNSLIITIIASLIVLEIIFFYERKSYILGLITTLPVVISLLWILGTMYLLGINFNVVTVTVTSLTIGLGIDYAIHITHRFLEDWDREESIEDAIRKTVRHTGTSIFGAATTTIAGFGTLILSSMPPIRQFGEIAALSILYSFILSVFILPSFLFVWAERREAREIELKKATPEIGKGYIFSSITLIATGSIIYSSAFYLRWIGWNMINSPSSFLIALAGIIIIMAGGEIYYRRRKKGNL